MSKKTVTPKTHSYTVEMKETVTRDVTVIVKATSEAEAREKAMRYDGDVDIHPATESVYENEVRSVDEDG